MHILILTGLLVIKIEEEKKIKKFHDLSYFIMYYIFINVRHSHNKITIHKGHLIKYTHTYIYDTTITRQFVFKLALLIYFNKRRERKKKIK